MTSLIKFKNRKFWVHDSIMQVVLAYLYCNLLKDDYFKSKREFLDDIRENSLGTYASYMNIKAEKFLSEPEYRLFALKALVIAMNLNSSDENEIHLHDFCNYQEDYQQLTYLPSSVSKDVVVNHLLKLVQLFEDYL